MEQNYVFLKNTYEVQRNKCKYEPCNIKSGIDYLYAHADIFVDLSFFCLFRKAGDKISVNETQ